jgi:hypothetical protein
MVETTRSGSEMATLVCIPIPEIPAKYSINMPGMGELVYLRDSLERMPRLSEIILKLLNAIQPALSPIYTVLKILDALQAVFNCLLAVKDAITTLNPGSIIRCFQKLYAAFAALLPLFPPLTYVRMVVDIVVLIRYLLDDVIYTFGLIDAEITSVKAVLSSAIENNDTVLFEIGQCRANDIQQATAGIKQILEVIGKTIGLLFTIMDLMAAVIPGPAGEKIEEAKETLAEITGQLDTTQSVGDFPPLGALLDALTKLRNLLLFVEQVGKAIVGLPFSFPQLQELVLQNP